MSGFGRNPNDPEPWIKTPLGAYILTGLVALFATAAFAAALALLSGLAN